MEAFWWEYFHDFKDVLARQGQIGVVDGDWPCFE
jgi:hypothetical protein